MITNPHERFLLSLRIEEKTSKYRFVLGLDMLGHLLDDLLILSKSLIHLSQKKKAEIFALVTENHRLSNKRRVGIETLGEWLHVNVLICCQ